MRPRKAVLTVDQSAQSKPRRKRILARTRSRSFGKIKRQRRDHTPVYQCGCPPYYPRWHRCSVLRLCPPTPDTECFINWGRLPLQSAGAIADTWEEQWTRDSRWKNFYWAIKTDSVSDRLLFYLARFLRDVVEDPFMMRLDKWEEVEGREWPGYNPKHLRQLVTLLLKNFIVPLDCETPRRYKPVDRLDQLFRRLQNPIGYRLIDLAFKMARQEPDDSRPSYEKLRRIDGVWQWTYIEW